MAVIDRFEGEHAFLSNFHAAPVKFRTFTFPTSEHAFVFAKNPKQWDPAWLKLTPGQVKRKGRKVKLIPQWDDLKIGIMHEIVSAKFWDDIDLSDALLATGTATLIEGNNWHDTFWGVCDGACRSGPHSPTGDNELGCILMAVRAELIHE